MLIRNIRNQVRQKTNTIALFAYGLIIGTSAPVLLTRCVSSGSGCSNCAGFCGLALGILPLILFVTMKNRIGHTARQALSLIRKVGNREQE